MRLWICIPVFNRIDKTLRCLETLFLQTYKNFIIVVCDHGSTDGTSDLIEEQFPDVVVINESSALWWTGAINVCIRYVLNNASSEDVLITLNNDTELPNNYLENFVLYSKKYPSSILTSVVYDINTKNLVSVGYRQNWGLAKALPVTFEHLDQSGDSNILDVTHASGRGTLFPIVLFRELGLFDEAFLPHYGADYDFTFKAKRNGYSIYVVKNCCVFSHVSETGMTKIRDRMSLHSFIEYFTSIRSPANIQARFWVAVHNCPKLLLPAYFFMDFSRLFYSYFRHFYRR